MDQPCVLPPTAPPPAPPGYVYGAICRVNFWVKMTTALGITQIVIGVSCVVFYTVAYFTDQSEDHVLRYLAVGLCTGTVITIAGILGMICCKKKTKCTIISFLVLSIFAAMFALLPLVLGVIGATSTVLGEASLLMPMCQLVFATVEIVVATWSIGVCSQAFCCPNSTFGHISTRTPSGLGITQFIASGDGQHVVLFASSPTSPSTFMYNMHGAQPPYIIQQGVPTLQMASQAGISCAIGQTGISPPPPLPPNYYDTQQAAALAGKSPPDGKTPSVGNSPENDKEGEGEGEKLLSEEVGDDGKGLVVVAAAAAAADVGGYEVDDEETHLLC